MSARFVSLAVGYSLAGGELRRKGIRQRPWLEIRRLETEHTYLDHQGRALRRAAPGPSRQLLDSLPGHAFYDISRLRFQHPLLERVMDICCPDGKQQVTPKALEVAGERGLALLWLDAGSWDGRTAVLRPRTLEDAQVIRSALQQRDIPCSRPSASAPWLEIAPLPMERLAEQLRPHVHRFMRHALRPGGKHGLALLRRSRPG